MVHRGEHEIFLRGKNRFEDKREGNNGLLESRKEIARKNIEKMRAYEESNQNPHIPEERNYRQYYGLCLTCDEPIGVFRKLIGHLYCKNHKR